MDNFKVSNIESWIKLSDKITNKVYKQYIRLFCEATGLEFRYLMFPFDLDFYKKRRELKKHIDRKVPGYVVSYGLIPLSEENEYLICYTICSPSDQFSKVEAKAIIIERLMTYSDKYKKIMRVQSGDKTLKIARNILIESLAYGSVQCPTKFRRLLQTYNNEGLLS